MNNHEDEDLGLDRELARLTQATAAIVPRDGYEERLMVLLGATTANDVSTVLFRFGKFGVAMGALVAAASVVLALNSAATVEQDDALAYATQEYFE